ncbi:hypothetical protein [Amycolatopsis sp. cg9]|uniref:hypothetical protein n=1 Tax=Amycolatopsis sp. cg9 TaxID=3238801 RepID=UPI00352545BA
MARPSVPARWLLLAALAFAVVAMHHVPAAHEPVAMTAATSMTADRHAGTPAPDHDGGHSPLHDCLAVLTAVALLLLAVLLLRYRSAAVVVVRRVPGVPWTARPPPGTRAGRTLLAAHCVLRI